MPSVSPRSNAANRASPSYRLPATDLDFLLGDSTRGLRFQLEYQKAEEALRASGIRSTVVAFGSARIRPDGPDKHRVWYEAARTFGHLVSLEGGALTPNGGIHDHVIATGGGPGIMEAANRGATEAGAPSIGFNITLPHEQEPNAWSTPHLTFNFHYFAMRKMHLAMRARGLCVFPGGFGTLDELFEILTLRQTGKMPPPCPVVLFDKNYWTRIFDLQAMAEEGFIHPDDLKLFAYADTPAEAWAIIRDGWETAR